MIGESEKRVISVYKPYAGSRKSKSGIKIPVIGEMPFSRNAEEKTCPGALVAYILNVGSEP